jgi:hypothetical protein
MRSLNLPWILSGLVCLYACEGTSTGNPTQDPKGGGTTGEGTSHGGDLGANCTQVSSMELDPDAQTSLGFSANDVLAFAAGAHEEKLTWNDQAGSFDYGPEHGEHGLTLRVTQKGAARLVSYTTDSHGGRGEIELYGGDECGDQLEIDVDVTLTTDQGALNETFATTLATRSDLAVKLYTTLDPKKLQGSFTATNLPQGFSLAQFSLDITLTKYGTQGSLRATIQTMSSGSGGSTGTGSVAIGGGSSRPLASWGPENCLYRGTALPLSAVVHGTSGADLLTLLNRSTTANVTFEGSAASAATISFSARSDRACVVLDNGFATIGGQGSIYVQAGLRIKSADGRIDATWPVAITSTSDDSGNVAQVQVAIDDESLSQEGTFATRYGLSGVDVSRFDSSRVQLMLTAAAQMPLDGTFEVTGFTNVPCTPMVTSRPGEGSSSSGCAGAMLTTVARARITAIAAP